MTPWDWKSVVGEDPELLSLFHGDLIRVIIEMAGRSAIQGKLLSSDAVVQSLKPYFLNFDSNLEGL